jgi:hypothetical protein
MNMPPLGVIQVLSRNGVAGVGLVKQLVDDSDQEGSGADLYCVSSSLAIHCTVLKLRPRTNN